MIIGLDPGLSGGVALMTDEGKLLEVYAMPVTEKSELRFNFKSEVDGRQLFNIIRGEHWGWGEGQSAFIEKVSAAPSQGVVSMFTFGQAYGTALGVLQALGFEVHKVSPSVWKTSMGLSRDKAQSLKMASKLWPEFDHVWRLKKNDGLAEAALIAEYGRKTVS